MAAGPFGGGLTLYLYSTLLLLPIFAWEKERAGLRDTVNSMLDSIRGRWTVVAALGFGALSAVVFYVGLASASNPTVFGAVSKLDAMLPFLLAIFILKEKPNGRVIFGAALAFAAGVLVVSFGNLEVGAALGALLFMILSATAITATKEALKRQLISPNGLVYLRQILVLTVLLALVLLFLSETEADGMNQQFQTRSALIAGALLTLLFVTRFQALKRIKQWEYTTLGAMQPIFMAIIALVAGEPQSLALWIAFSLVALGEFIAFFSARPTKLHI